MADPGPRCPRGRENRAGQGRGVKPMPAGIGEPEDAAPAKVCSVTRWCLSPGSVINRLAGPARGLDLLAGGLREAVSVHGQRLAELAVAEHLDGHVAPRGEARVAQRVRRDLGARVEALLEVPQVHRLGLRAELLERHRLLHGRAAELAHPHVDRVLPALEAHAPLVAGAGAGALVTAAGGLAHAGALAAADPLALLARAGRRLQRVEADALTHRLSPSDAPNEAVHAPCDGPPAPSFARSSQVRGSSASPAASGSSRWPTSPG